MQTNSNSPLPSTCTTIEEWYPGYQYKGKWRKTSVLVFCPFCTNKKKAEDFASTEIKIKARNPEYEMACTDGVILWKMVRVEDHHLNPAFCPCAQINCIWEECDSCKAAYVIPSVVKVNPADECILPQCTSDHGIQKETQLTENSSLALGRNEQSKDFCDKGIFCVEAEATMACRSCQKDP